MSSERLMYDDYLRTVAERFENRFADIAAEWNFELGVEFEITLCRVLRQVLPHRYGVCRGFVATRGGEKKGDDIIIYDRDRSPTLRLVEQDGFERKESIPVEAVYAYIEAKHTLFIEGSGGQSISKACDQVRAVKSLPRDVVPWTYQDPYVAQAGEIVQAPAYWPPSRNQMFGAILARHVRRRSGGALLDESSAITAALRTALLGVFPQPDLIVAGPDVVCLPTVNHGYHSPFQLQGKTHLSSSCVDGLAFGIGICSLLLALDMMRVGPMPWPMMLAEAIGLRVVTEEQRGDLPAVLRLPMYVLTNPEHSELYTVGSDDKTLLAMFTTEHAAKQHIVTAGCEGTEIVTIQTPNRLREILSDIGRQGLDEVAFDPVLGSNEFLSCYIPFLFEYFDMSGQIESIK
jgi:hypothetical protein